MKVVAHLLLVTSVLFLEPSNADCATRCGDISTCAGEDPETECAACDPETDCVLVVDTTYCNGCTCVTGCAVDSTCEGTPTTDGGAESCEECLADAAGDCVPDPAYCDLTDCLTCEEACGACEGGAGPECFFTETDVERSCICTCPTGCDTCEDDEFCSSKNGGDCECLVNCDININASACGVGCTAPESCDVAPDGSGCMCVPDCTNDAACGTENLVCESVDGNTCELNPEKTDCQCAFGRPPVCDDGDCNTGGGCTDDDEICDDLNGDSTCECVLNCNVLINGSACDSLNCDPQTEVCDEDLDGAACTCVPNCSDNQICGSDGYDCQSNDDTCELNAEKTDCECSLGRPPCQPIDCDSGMGCPDEDEICYFELDDDPCDCLVKCDDNNPEACGGGCDTTPETPDCHVDLDGTGCMCVPDCGNQGSSCGSAGDDCNSASDTCELNPDYTDCVCSKGTPTSPPPVPSDSVPSDCQQADCSPACTGDEICDDTPDGLGCMCVPNCSADDANCGSAGYDCESASDTCVLTSDKTDCECSQGTPPTTTEDSTTAGAVANAGVFGALLVMVSLMSLTAA